MSNQLFIIVCPLTVLLLNIAPFGQSASLPFNDLKGTCTVRPYEMMGPLRMHGPDSSTTEFENSFGLPYNIIYADGHQYRYRYINKIQMECNEILDEVPKYEGDDTLMVPQHTLPFSSGYGYILSPASPNKPDSADMMFICRNCTIPNLTANTTHKMATQGRYMYLDFADSKMAEIHANALANFPQLSALNLRDNQLKSLPERLFWNQQFQIPLQLSLQNNNFLNISNALCNANEIEFLNLQDNKINSMRVDCKLKVTNLNMSNNMIGTLDLDALEDYANLRLLDLSFNHLRDIIHAEGSNLDKVTHLFWNDNDLGRIGRRYFRRFSTMQNLVLSRNGISSLDVEGFKDLKALIHLDLSQNLISDIPFGIFKDLEMLKDLNLAGNKLKQFSMQTFAGLTELKYLNVSSNFLKQIASTDLLQIKQLQAMDLSNNRLSKLDANAILNQHPIMWMAIKNNFWNCQQLLQILQYARERNCNVKRGVLFNVPNIHGIACSSKNASLGDKVDFAEFLSTLSDEKEMELILSKMDSVPVDETNELEATVNKIKSLVLLIAVLFVVDFIFQWLFRLYQARHTMNIPISTLK